MDYRIQKVMEDPDKIWEDSDLMNNWRPVRIAILDEIKKVFNPMEWKPQSFPKWDQVWGFLARLISFSDEWMSKDNWVLKLNPASASSNPDMSGEEYLSCIKETRFLNGVGSWTIQQFEEWGKEVGLIY